MLYPSYFNKFFLERYTTVGPNKQPADDMNVVENNYILLYLYKFIHTSDEEKHISKFISKKILGFS